MTTISQIREKVRSLNQWVIVATIIAFLGLIAVILFFLFKPEATTSQAGHQIIQLSDNIHKFYRNQPGYWGLNNASALQNGIAPKEMTKEEKILNSLGKEVLLGGDNSGGMVMPGARSFNIVFTDLNKKECWSLAAKGLSEKEMLGLISITIDNGGKEVLFNWGGENPLPIISKDAARACGKKNKLIWSFE